MIIRARQLSKSYRLQIPDSTSALRNLFRPRSVVKPVLNGIDLLVEKGDIVGCIGPNGSGKSTAIKILTGILSPTSGSVRVCGLDPVPFRQTLARRIGVVFGNRSQLLWDIPVVETLRLYAELYRLGRDAACQRVSDLVDMLELAEFRHQTPRTLSLGQRIRADLAISLMHSPELILLDEPTIGLDTLLKIKFRGILKTLNAVYGTTVLLTTHDMNDIEAVCSRVIILHRGSIAFDGSVSDLRRRVTNETEIRLEFSDMSAQQNLALFPKELVTASAVSPTEIRVRFRDFEIPTHRVLQMAVQASALESLAILNPSIEEIIAQIYTEHGERP